MMINQARKDYIKDLAEFIVDDYSDGTETNLYKILEDENISLFHDHYENYFDGMLVYSNNHFYIQLNLDKGNLPGTPRERFSLAHELGHLFIEEHYRGLINGDFNAHPSKFELKRDNKLEIEADQFAAYLLMPSQRFKEVSKNKPFSFDLIKELANAFKTSKLSTIIRFTDTDAGTYPLMVSFFQNQKLKWFVRSNDFPYKAFKTKIGKPPPPTSVLGEYYDDSEAKYTGIERIYADDWFYTDSTQKLNEQCFYSNYGYDISMIWPD